MIGVGITTRNRPDVLNSCLEHFYAFSEKSTKIVVVDDASDFDHTIVENYGYERHKNPERLGIAKSKNKCLSLLTDCDYIFLFDDDCFPRQKGWEQYFINAHLKTGIHHFNQLPSSFSQVDNIIDGRYEINGVKINRFSGVGFASSTMFLTKRVLDEVGGYDKNYGFYGYEHCGYSIRVHRAGLTLGIGPWLAMDDIEEYLYSYDHMYTNLGIKPPLSCVSEFKQSIHGENRDKFVQENEHIFQTEYYGDIYKPL